LGYTLDEFSIEGCLGNQIQVKHDKYISDINGIVHK